MRDRDRERERQRERERERERKTLLAGLATADNINEARKPSVKRFANEWDLKAES